MQLLARAISAKLQRSDKIGLVWAIQGMACYIIWLQSDRWLGPTSERPSATPGRLVQTVASARWSQATTMAGRFVFKRYPGKAWTFLLRWSRPTFPLFGQVGAADWECTSEKWLSTVRIAASKPSPRGGGASGYSPHAFVSHSFLYHHRKALAIRLQPICNILCIPVKTDFPTAFIVFGGFRSTT